MSSEYLEEALVDEAETDIVHWMEPKPVRLGPGGAAAAVVGGFALGVIATLAALALARLLDDEDDVVTLRRL
jgi:hypothetical protein